MSLVDGHVELERGARGGRGGRGHLSGQLSVGSPQVMEASKLVDSLEPMTFVHSLEVTRCSSDVGWM